MKRILSALTMLILTVIMTFGQKSSRSVEEVFEATSQIGCFQQYISRVLKGTENLTIETISKIEDALKLEILEPVFAER